MEFLISSYGLLPCPRICTEGWISILPSDAWWSHKGGLDEGDGAAEWSVQTKVEASARVPWLWPLRKSLLLPNRMWLCIPRKPAHESERLPSTSESSCGFHAVCNFRPMSFLVVPSWPITKTVTTDRAVMSRIPSLDAAVRVFVEIHSILPGCSMELTATQTFRSTHSSTKLLSLSISAGSED